MLQGDRRRADAFYFGMRGFRNSFTRSVENKQLGFCGIMELWFRLYSERLDLLRLELRCLELDELEEELEESEPDE